MICPNCGRDNVPGVEQCEQCLQDLTQLDRPTAHEPVERSLMEDKVTTLRPRAPVTVRPTQSLREAMDRLLAERIGSLLVVDADGKLLGILSERDLLTKVAGLQPAYPELPVGQFMTPSPETVTGQDTIAFAIHKMDIGGYRHLPIVEGGRPVGVVSVRDVLRHLARMCG